MKASDKDVSIFSFNKRSREVRFKVFDTFVSLKYRKDVELYIDRRRKYDKAAEIALAELENYLVRIGLMRYGACAFRFPNFMTLSALKILHTLNSPGTVSSDTYEYVSKLLDTFMIPVDQDLDLNAQYRRLCISDGRRAIEMTVESLLGDETSVLFSDGCRPLYIVPYGTDPSTVQYVLHAAISAYQSVYLDPIDDDWIPVEDDAYYNDIFHQLQPTNLPEFNVTRVKEEPEPETPVPSNPVDVDVLGLLRSAEAVKAHLPIGVCVPLAALKYGELYFTVGAVTGYESNSEYSLLRIQYYRKRPVDRDPKVPMHLAAVANYGVVSFTAPDNVSIVDCCGMAPVEFAKLVEQYAAVLRR